MDRAKKSRKPVRQRVTKLCNDVDAEIATQVPFKDTLVNLIERLEQQMAKLIIEDEKVKEAMLDEDKPDEDLEQDEQNCEEYFSKIREAITKAKAASITPVVTPTISSSSTPNPQIAGMDINVKLPKIELPKFSGEIKDWLSWWAQFEQIHANTKISDSDKFRYLSQCLVKGTKAAQSIDGFQVTADNYPKAIEILKNQFGNHKVLWKFYLRELAKLIQDNGPNKPKMSLFSMYHKLEAQLRALESLGNVTRDDFLYPLVETSIPTDTLLAWQRSTNYRKDGSKENPPKTDLDYLREFLQYEVENENVRILADTDGGKDKKNNSTRADGIKSQKTKEDSIPTAAGLFSGQDQKKGKVYTCIFCDKPHPSPECVTAQSMTKKEKYDLINEKKACGICFRVGHKAKYCKTPVRCVLCSKKHYPLMCPELPDGGGYGWKPEKKLKEKDKDKEKEKCSEEENSAAMTSHECTGDVLLQTLQVRLYNDDGKYRVARLVFDNGSQGTSVRQDSVRCLKLKPIKEIWSRKVLFGGQVTDIKKHHQYQLRITSMDGKKKKDLLALDEKEICGRIGRVPKGPWLKELAENNIQINDIGSETPEIEILVGSDYYGQFMTGRILQLKCGLTAFESILGWTLGGKLPGKETIAMTALSTALHSCHETIQKLWDLETLGIMEPSEVKSKTEREEETKLHFQETVSRDEEGRYSVQLPWVAGSPTLPDNKAIAKKRLDSTTKKLKEAGKLENYHQIFQDWLKEGFVEKVHVYKEEDKAHYLPHHAVFKPSSLTTPVRPVFDASCKTGRNPSLNDCLEKGPNLLELIPSILLRFREKKIGVTADVRKAFQMIEVNKNDRDFLRFLWWEDPKQEKLQIFRHKRVVFGVNCSPFLLGAVLELHVDSIQDERKEIAQKLLKSMYVDNCVTSVDTPDEYEEFKAVSTQLLEEAKMDLRQWECGAMEGSKVGSPPEECGLVTGSDHNPQELTAVLGLKWNKQKDYLMVEIPSQEMSEKISRRIILSQVQKIFDPMGFLSPSTVVPKIILQKTWEENSKWDEELGEDVRIQFQKWWTETPDLQKIKIPRFVFFGTRVDYQIHVFSDASKKAYAAVVFISSIKNGKTSIQLLQSKSRVAPMKTTTIPRLELLGCTISSRLAVAVKKSLEYEDVPTFFWTDSTTALAWIKRKNEWGTFVGNRVKEICQLTNVEQWRHVPGKMNPADLPSRGCSPSELLASKWWEGPEWLKDPTKWPSQEDIEENEEEVMAEKKKKSIMQMFSSVSDPWYIHYSSFTKNLRRLAFVIRFVDKCRRKNTQRGELTRLEIEAAEKKLFIMVQEESFPDQLKGQVGITTVGGIRAVRDDKDGLMKVITKLTLREDTQDFKKPVLLPNSHPIVDQLIMEEHVYNGHGGAQFLMGRLREKCWILQGRKAVRRILKKCVICRRFTAKAPCVQEAPLPQDRIKDTRVFQVVGVDLAGPFFLKNGTKAYAVIFTCAVYRAIHLELVNSISTEDFLLSLDRFISRRGRPATIYSDNGTNFVGAENLFKKLDWKRILTETQVLRIQWKFNPPSAAWWGGFWERLIRSVKDLLKRMLGHRKLNHDQLQTSLCKAEAVINSRPLTLVTEDQDDLIPLTPAMFIQDRTEVSCPEIGALDGKGLRKAFKRFQVTRVELKHRFRKEYLALLVHRGKTKKSIEYQLGDVVLIGDDNKKRLEWPLGRIVELYPGKDGKIRMAKVKTMTNHLLRPIQRLYPLELSCPMDIPTVPNDVKKKAVGKKAKANKKEQEEQKSIDDPEIVTRVGRRVKKPERLGV